MEKISALTAITSVQTDDVLPILDVHDTTTPPAGPGGSTKKMTLSQLPFDAAGAATAATTYFLRVFAV